MDETACALNAPLMRCWCKRGKQPRIPAAKGATTMLHLSGGMDLVTGEITATFSTTRNSNDFIAFLDELMCTRYPTQQVILILDNASFHTSQASQAAMALLEERLQLLFLPTHAPTCNPIERFWRYLKENALGNRLCTSLAEVRLRLEDILAIQNDLTHPDRYVMSN